MWWSKNLLELGNLGTCTVWRASIITCRLANFFAYIPIRNN